MAQCSYCGTTILFGGVTDSGHRFCNERCHQGAHFLNVARTIAPDVLERQLEEVFRSNCPECRGPGPVDVHKIYQVWSALILTRWSSSQKVCCRSCGIKSQIGGILFSGALGWWGFPWGLIFTPVQIIRNVIGICSGPDTSRPSADLRRIVQMKLGAELLNSTRRRSAQAPPPLPR
jgi:hypothetical protein